MADQKPLTTLSYAATDRMKSIINPESVSFEQVLRDLETDLLARPNGQSWTSRFNGGVGTTLMEWLAAVLGEAKTAALLGSRESSIQTARTKENVVRLAAQLGYIYNRATAARFELTLQVTTPQLVSKGTKVGASNSGLLYSVEDQNISAANPTLRIITGAYVSSPLKVSQRTADLFGIRFTAKELNVQSIAEIDSRTMELLVNGESVKYTMFPEKMGEDGNMVLVRQDYGVIELVGGAGTSFGRRWTQGDQVVLKYVITDGTKDLKNNEISLSLPGTALVSSKLTEPWKETDSSRKVSLLAPGFHNSRRSAVTKRDYEVLLTAFQGMESAKWFPGTCSILEKGFDSKAKCTIGGGVWTDSVDDAKCCTAPLVYLFKDEHKITDLEKLEVYKYFEDIQFAGTEITFIDPVAKAIDMSVELTVLEGITEAQVLEITKNLIKNQTLLLGHTYRPSEVVRGLDDLNGIVHTYIQTGAREIKALPNEYFILGTVTVKLRTTSSIDLTKFGV